MLTSSKSNWQNNQKNNTNTQTLEEQTLPPPKPNTSGNGLLLCKYFQASIGKHLKESTTTTTTESRVTSNARRQPADSVRRLRTRSSYHHAQNGTRNNADQREDYFWGSYDTITYSRRTQSCVDKKKAIIKQESSKNISSSFNCFYKLKWQTQNHAT